MHISERMKQLNINQMENEVNGAAISCTWQAAARARYALIEEKARQSAWLRQDEFKKVC